MCLCQCYSVVYGLVEILVFDVMQWQLKCCVVCKKEWIEFQNVFVVVYFEIGFVWQFVMYWGCLLIVGDQREQIDEVELCVVGLCCCGVEVQFVQYFVVQFFEMFEFVMYCFVE